MCPATPPIMPREAGRAASRVLRHVRGRRGAEVAQHAQHEVAEDAPSGTPPILPCLARLYANTSLDKPLTRNLRADLELLRRSNTSLLGEKHCHGCMSCSATATPACQRKSCLMCNV